MQDILDRQKRAQLTAHDIDIDNLSLEQRVEFITWNVLALTDELHEALAETSWKPWADSTYINTDAFKGELIDALHFFVNLALAAGMDEDEITWRYHAKRDKNDARQRDGYDGWSTKCPACKRALDDPAVACTTTACAING